MKTLQEILSKEKEHRHENGDFGIKACKESILFDIEVSKKYNLPQKSLYQYLEEYVARANADVFFNNAMVLACWELINEQ